MQHVSRGLLVVQSRPASEAQAAEYHRWYDEVHIPELLALGPFRTARRLRSLDGDSFLAVYEVDDVEAAKAAMAEARAAGRSTPPTAIQLDPPPTVQWFVDR